MGTPISRFTVGGLLRITDILAGLRGAAPNQIDNQFSVIGIGDSLGANLITWTPGAGPNVNYIDFQSNIAGASPVISALGTDTTVNLILLPQGDGNLLIDSTAALGVPYGTTAQRPAIFLGAMRLNTTVGFFEVSVDGVNWVDLAEGGGGIITVDGTANQITATTVGAVVTLSLPSTLIAPGTFAATTSVSAPEYLLTGASSGTISILPQAASGTYNFNMPITAGTSGYLLTSAGGAGSPMTWTDPTSIGGVTSITGTTHEITASASTGAITLSIPSTFIAPGTIAATTSSAAPEFLLNGASSGTISILPQAAAGTYNFNLPITAGTSGYLLTSAGGGSSPMTWTQLSTVAVTSISGTANEITASASTGAVTLSIPSTFIAPGTIAAVTSVATPEFLLNGSSSGTISILPQAAAGTYNFNLPITAGTSGYLLTSAGGAGSPMTWTANTGASAIQTINGDSGSMSGTTVTISGGTTGLTTSASSATMDLTGTLKLANGGTNANLTASNGGIFYSTATAGAILAGTATAQQLLMSGASTTPQWSTSTYPTTNAINTLLYASSANVMAALATANSSVLTTSGAGVPTWSVALSSAIGGTQVENSSGSLIALGLSDSGSANAYAVSISPAPAAYAVGQTINFVAANANTTASTLAVNALGTKAITKHGATALASGDIVAGQVCTVVYDGTQFQLENPVASAGTGTVTSVATGVGLSGGTITSTGTINLSTTISNGYRLTLTSNTPVTTSDVTGASAVTIFMTPYIGDDIDIFSGSAWSRFRPGQLSIAVPATTNTMYDVFVDYNSGTPLLTLVAWTNQTTRATALVYQNGVLVQFGKTTSRYLGSFTTTGTSGQTANSLVNRLLWNYNNRIMQPMYRNDPTDSWTYTTATLRQANANTANQFGVVIGVVEDSIRIRVQTCANISAATLGTVIVGIGINSTTATSATIWPASGIGYGTGGGAVSGVSCEYANYPLIGYNFYAWLEASTNNGGTTTWFSDHTFLVGNSLSGLYGEVLG